MSKASFTPWDSAEVLDDASADFLTWWAAVLPESQNSAVFEPLLG